MKILKFKPPEWLIEDFHWGDDIKRIILICANRGYHISEADAHHAWEAHSDSYAAGWLQLDSDDQDVFDAVMDHCAHTEVSRDDDDWK
jgi:hypothetical protein